MKILSCCPRGYYSAAEGTSYEYLSFVEVPRRMGHSVDCADHVREASADRAAFNERLLKTASGYDLVLVVTSKDELLPETLDELRRHVPVVAWNCDDDYRWEDYSSRYAPHYTYMVTTYRHIYEANRAKHPNLLLGQWGCTGLDEGGAVRKDLDVSFVGLAYGKRIEQIQRLRRSVRLQPFGKNIPPPPTLRTWLRQRIGYRLFGTWWTGQNVELPDQASVKAIWNRSRVSFTPLDASRGGVVQIKARVFDMGLSGAVMICTRNPALHEFYEPGKEYVEFESMDECEDRIRFLLAHETERAGMAERYGRRTRAEHLWTHRFTKLFRDMGVA